MQAFRRLWATVKYLPSKWKDGVADEMIFGPNPTWMMNGFIAGGLIGCIVAQPGPQNTLLLSTSLAGGLLGAFPYSLSPLCLAILALIVRRS